MIDAKIETISIINSCETGSIYFSVNAGPYSDQIKMAIFFSDDNKISLICGLLDVLV